MPNHLQEGQERRCRELQVSQPQYIPWKIMKQNFLEAISKHAKTCFIAWIVVESITSAGLQIVTNCRGTSDTLESRTAIQRDVNRQEKICCKDPHEGKQRQR